MSPFYKYLLVNASKQLESKSLKSGNFLNLIIIEESSFKSKRLSSWKPKDLRLPETEDEEKLKEGLFNTEQQKNKDIEVL